MTHMVSYNSGLGVIETIAQGKLTFREAQEIMSDITQIAIAKKCFLCLSDYRQATMEMSTLQIYDLPKALSDVVTSLGLHPSQFKRAIVVEKSWQDFYFFETVSQNSVQNIRQFQDIDEAKRWLLQK